MLRRLIDVLILFSSLFAIAMFILVLFFSYQYWMPTFNSATTLEAKMFWAGLLIAIVSGIMSFTEGFIRAFASSYKDIFRKEAK